MASSSSLPYVEADTVTILVLSSFLVLSNALGSALDQLLYCGIIGQILLGVAWGTPGSKWLSETTEATMVQLGYLGLILMVYQGGLSTSFASLRANLLLSCFVALTGICLPIALSFVLTSIAGASYLQAFAAGAALCSTSLGTTFTVLSTTGLARTRLGVVLISAAMMDDVVGLVIVKVVSSLGITQNAISAVAILRPVLGSVAFVICVPVVCRLVVEPITEALNQIREKKPLGMTNRVLLHTEAVIAIHIILLTAFVAISSFAGTSNLFAAYLAGAAVCWWDTEVSHVKPTVLQVTPSQRSGVHILENRTPTKTPNDPGGTSTPEHLTEHSPVRNQQRSLGAGPFEHKTSGNTIFDSYLEPALHRLLKPFFFASIGFSIPITKMFSGTVIWKGLVYTILMILGKCMCGIWLVRTSRPKLSPLKLPLRFRIKLCGISKDVPATKGEERSSREASVSENLAPIANSNDQTNRTAEAQDPDAVATALPLSSSEDVQRSQKPHFQLASPSPPHPVSLYAPTILASAMVARGEIGFLISAVAQSNGSFDGSATASSTAPDSEIFLVVTWAIVLCTLLGPLCTGSLVRRVKNLEENSAREDSTTEGRRGVLGVWGVQ